MLKHSHHLRGADLRRHGALGRSIGRARTRGAGVCLQAWPFRAQRRYAIVAAAARCHCTGLGLEVLSLASVQGDVSITVEPAFDASAWAEHAFTGWRL